MLSKYYILNSQKSSNTAKRLAGTPNACLPFLLLSSSLSFYPLGEAQGNFAVKSNLLYGVGALTPNLNSESEPDIPFLLVRTNESSSWPGGAFHEVTKTRPRPFIVETVDTRYKLDNPGNTRLPTISVKMNRWNRF